MVEKYVVDKIFWPETPLLESVGQHEPQIDRLRCRVETATRQSLIPLLAYARQYDQYLELMNLDIKTYISGFAAASSPTEEDPQSLDKPAERVSTLVRVEIEKHLKGKEAVEKSLPQSVDIGPFHINTDTVRLALAKKHKEIVKALLEFLVLQLRKESEQISEQFRELSQKLYERPNCIEDLTEQREFVKTVPDLIQANQSRIDQVMADYDLLDDYFFTLSDEDFENRWNTLAWPGKITDHIDSTETQMEQDNQKFLKKLSDDQQQLEDRLDTLQLVVAGFSGRTDIGKAAETANEVRRVTKELKDCQQQASLYNQRERLFELPVTQYDKVGKLMRDFEPYRTCG
jgi:dynein heavy chain